MELEKRTLIVSAALAAMSALGGVKDGVPHIWIQHIIVPDVNCNGLFLPAKDGEGIKKPFFMPDGSKQRMKLAPGLRVFRIRTFGSLESWTETEITLRSVL